MYDFRPRSVAWMLPGAEAGPLQNALVSFNVDVRCDLINPEAKSWLPPTAQPKVKAIGELGDVRSFHKHVNGYYSRAKEFATADTQNNYFPFDDAVAKEAPCSAYYRCHYSLPPVLAQDFYNSVSSHALFLRGDVQVMSCDELRGESSYNVVPTREIFRKHPGELLPWELVGTLVGQTKSLRVRISSTQVQGKFGIFCGLDTSKVVPTRCLSLSQMVAQALFQNGGLLLFSVRHSPLVCFTSDPQYGRRVWSKDLTQKVTPYNDANPHRVWLEAPRSTPTYEVAAAASLLGTIKCFDAKQQSGSTCTFEVRYTDEPSAALATDVTAEDIIFTAALPNAVLRNQLITSISELLENDSSEEEKALVSVLQVGSSLASREPLQKFERMYNSIKCVMNSYAKVRNWVETQDMLITPEKYREPGTSNSPGMCDGAPSSAAKELASAFKETTPTGRPINDAHGHPPPQGLFYYQNVLPQEWQTRLHGEYSDRSIEWSPGKQRKVRWYGWHHTPDGPVPSAPISKHFNGVVQAVAALPLPEHVKRDSFGEVQVSCYKPDGGL